MLRFRLLGPVHAEVEGHPVKLGPRGQRFVAAVLLLEINTLVPTGRLVDLLWPYEPPARARGIVRNHASGLRRILRGVNDSGPHDIHHTDDLEVTSATVRAHLAELAGARPLHPR